MLPPVDPLILSANPKFNALYRDICTNKLSADGTSKLDAKAQRDRDTLSEELHKARVESAKKDLVKSGLEDLSYRGSALPEDLQQLVAVIAALLDDQIAEEDKYLLHGDLKKFKANIKQINAALLRRMHQDATALATIIDPDDPPRSTDLAASIQNLKSSISTNQLSLADSRVALAQEASKLHRIHRQIIERSINILEQTIHGSVARGAKAKADYIAMVAEGMSKKVNLQHQQLMAQVYSPTFQEALEAKFEELQRENRSITRKVSEAEDRLDEYRKISGMETLAKEYADILKETEKVKADISRLEKARR